MTKYGDALMKQMRDDPQTDELSFSHGWQASAAHTSAEAGEAINELLAIAESSKLSIKLWKKRDEAIAKAKSWQKRGGV